MTYSPCLQDATLELCTLLKRKDISGLSQWRLKEPWVTVDHLIKATGGLQPASRTCVVVICSIYFVVAVSSPSIGYGPPVFPTSASGTGQWQCKHCTYLNMAHASECEVCQLPRN